jgi:tRNA(fMet)-specific endonuclease VapC
MTVARTHAEIWAALESDGNLIGAHDLWIAATALSQGMTVATANTRDLKRVPGLDVVPV